MEYDHFKGKDALSHLAEKQAKGYLTSKEIHGLEVPGYIHAFTDSLRDTTVFLALFFALFIHFDNDPSEVIQMIFLLGVGWLLWKMGRSAYLAWSRLERLHRVLAQEKWEIEHNRPQER